jgi:uncharacterized membrane protein
MDTLKFKIIAGIILALVLIIWVVYFFINDLFFGNLEAKIEVILILIICVIAIFRERIKSFISIVKQ